MTPPARHLPSELALLAVLALALAPTLTTLAPNPDAFTYLSHGLRLLAGQVIYRDFFEFTPPGAPLLAAALFAVTGPSLLAARVLQAVALLGAAVLLARLTRRLGADPWAATLPGLVLVLALYRFQPHWSYHWLVVPAVAGAALAACNGFARDARRDWLLAGLGVGLAGLLLHADGVVVAAALAGALVADVLVGRFDLRQLARRSGLLLAGALAPLVPVLGWLAWHGALAAAWYDVWVWPFTHYATPGGPNDIRFLCDLWAFVSPYGGRWVSLPHFYATAYHGLALYALVVGAALGALAWAAGVVLRLVRDGRIWSPAEAAWGLCGLLALGFALLAARGRADIVHVALYAFPAVVVATAAASAFARRLAAPELIFLRGLPLAAIALFALTGAGLWAQELRARPDWWLRGAGPDAHWRAAPLVRWLAERARPGDRVAAFPNGGFVYFYALPPAVPHTLFLPTGYLSADEARAYWAAIRRERPRFLVFVPHDDPARTRQAYFPEGLPAGWRLAARLEAPLGERTPWPTEIYERTDAGSGEPAR